MKTNISILSILVFTFFIQCKEKPEFINYKIPHLDASIKLPASYVSLNERKFKKEDALLQKIYNANRKQTILIDTTNNNNFIIILPATYQKIDSTVLYIFIDKERKKSSKTVTVDSMYFFGSRIGSIRNYKYIESKYQGIKKNNKDLFVKSIVISSATKTVGISFFSEKNPDTKPFIDSISEL